MSKILCVFVTLLTIAVLTPATATADPIVITGGTLSVTGLTGGPQFNLTGDNFAVVGLGEQGSSHPQMSCGPCESGKAIDLGGFFAGTSGLGGGLGGTLTLTAPTIIVPNIASDITLTSPFTLSAHLLFCPGDCSFQPPTFSVDLVGSGTATISLHFIFLRNGNPVFFFQNVTYDFQAPEPTPEPMSILLLGGGLVGLAAKLRRHRWRR
jgi:hypothetical protein